VFLERYAFVMYEENGVLCIKKWLVVLNSSLV
jgi:hypothetical protein